jgi:hypothetical protein
MIPLALQPSEDQVIFPTGSKVVITPQPQNHVSVDPDQRTPYSFEAINAVYTCAPSEPVEYLGHPSYEQ